MNCSCKRHPHFASLLPVLVILIGLAGFGGSPIRAQDFDGYSLLKSGGEIPEELLRLPSEKYRERREKLKGDGDPLTRATRAKFLLENSFALDKWLLGGNVVLNDPVSSYLNEIKDLVLRDFPDIRDSVNVVLLRSPSTNAFAASDGTIFFNMGLLGRVKNEAELAFSICHEVQHYMLNHSLLRYVAKERMGKGKSFQSRDMMQAVQDRNQYSREQETQADEKGIELYLHSDYALEAVDRVFLVLRDARQPYEMRPWDFSFFETDNLRFPAAYHLDSLSPVEVDEHEDDSRSSHPNIASRRKLGEEMLAGKESGGRREFIVSEEKFHLCQKICRYEMAHLYLEQRSYEAAIYQAYLLLGENPESFYLHKTVAQALYGLARHKNDLNFYAVHTDHEAVSGEPQQLHYFMGQMEKAGLNVLALDWSWRLHRAHPEDRELALVCKDLLDDLFRCHREVAESMSHLPAPTGYFDPWQVKEEEAEVAEEELDSMGGMELAEMEEKATLDYFQHAFAAYFRDPEFVTAYQNLVLEEPETNDEEYLSPRRRRKMERRRLVDGEALGVDKVVFVEPDYIRVDERKSPQTDLLGSERSKMKLLRQVRETAELAGLEGEVLSIRDLEADEMERLNDLVVMERWIEDFMLSSENETQLVNLFADEARQVAEKYGTDHVAFTKVFMLTRKKSPLAVTGLVLSGVMIIPLPLVMVALVKPRRSVYYRNLVFDVARNELVQDEFRRITVTPFPFIIKSHLYSSMHQMNRK